MNRTMNPAQPAKDNLVGRLINARNLLLLAAVLHVVYFAWGMAVGGIQLTVLFNAVLFYGVAELISLGIDVRQRQRAIQRELSKQHNKIDINPFSE